LCEWSRAARGSTHTKTGEEPATSSQNKVLASQVPLPQP